MQFELTQEQEILRETARDFAQREIAPISSRIDSDCNVPSELFAELARLGMFGISVPSVFGGAEADFLSVFIVGEEISRASGSLGALVAFHNAVICESLLKSKNAKLKKDLLPNLAAGSLGAFDFSALQVERDSKGKSKVNCKIEGGDLVIDGKADFVFGASFAKVFLVLANLETPSQTEKVLFAFSKDKIKDGIFTIGEPKKLLGMRASGSASISFNSFRLSKESLVHEISETSAALNEVLSKARLAVASQALGIAQASLDASVKYSNERAQFETKIGEFYAVQDMIASAQIELVTSRSLSYLVASKIANYRDLEEIQRDSAASKISASNASISAARRSIRIHGGYGFTRDYPVERYARDARLTLIFPETNEDLKSLIARSLLGSNRI